MKNDYDFIKERIDNSGVDAPAHMDERWAQEQLADVQPRVSPAASAQPQEAPVSAIGQQADAASACAPRNAPLHSAQPSKKRRTGRFTAIAAAVVAVAVLGTALTVHFTRKAQPSPLALTQADAVTGLIRFNSYDEVHAAVDQLQARVNRYDSDRYATNEMITADDASLESYAGVPSGAGDIVGKAAAVTEQSEPVGGSDSHSETYKQVDGVDEADRIKTDGRYIYIIDGDYSPTSGDYIPYVSVFQAKAGVTEPFLRIRPGVSYVSELPATLDEATPDEAAAALITSGKPAENLSVCDLYLKDDRMVILCTVGSGGWGYYRSYSSDTRAYVYDIADMRQVRLLDTFTQSGSYTSSRMIGDILYLVTNQYSMSAIPCCGRGEEPDQLAADCIYSVVDPTQESFLIVSAYDTRDYTADTDSKAVLGLGSDVYCSRDNLYISAADYSGYYGLWLNDYAVTEEIVYADGAADSVSDSAAVDNVDDGAVKDNSAGEEEDDFYTPKTKIFKVSLHDGVNFTAYGEIEGYTNNQYSFDEYNGYLRVAATSNNRDYQDVNNLYVLDGDLHTVGSVTGFAATESIKAVRYVGDTAYVITYEQTDPLFVIDLSDPASPAILGEVKISGFSTMLVPVDDNTLLGIGYNTGEYDYTDLEVQDGVKLALFDVSDRTNPKVLDSRSYVHYSSQVQYDPKALVCNSGRGDYLLPMSYYYFDDSNGAFAYDYDDDDWERWEAEWERWYEEHTEQYGAVLNFRVENGRIIETEMHITGQEDIERCVYVGDTVFGVWFDENAARLVSFEY